MSIFAPIAPPRLGLEPVAHHGHHGHHGHHHLSRDHRRRRSSAADRAAAAHVLAAAAISCSSVADAALPLVPAQLSLKGLLQSENVQTIQENLIVLARFADHLPRDVDPTSARVTNDELLIMGRLVRDISSSLERIGSLRDEEDEMLPYVADKYVPMRPISSVARRRRKEKMKLKMAHKCHNCNRLDTPQWRPGPDGPRTLCNVCGLIYTKRQQRHAEKMIHGSQDE